MRPQKESRTAIFLKPSFPHRTRRSSCHTSVAIFTGPVLMGLSIERMSRSGRRSSIAVRYGGATVCAVGGLVLRAAMGPELAGRFPNAGSFIGCLVAARFLGLGPAILVIAVALADAFLFGHRPEPGREILFLVMAGVAVWI